MSCAGCGAPPTRSEACEYCGRLRVGRMPMFEESHAWRALAQQRMGYGLDQQRMAQQASHPYLSVPSTFGGIFGPLL